MPEAEALTFTTFTDLVLVRVHDEERKEGTNQFFDVHELVSDVPGVQPGWAQQAVELLGQQGLVHPVVAFGDTAQAALTPKGRMYVENEDGTGLIARYHSRQLVVVAGDGNQVVVAGRDQTGPVSYGGFSKEEVEELLDQAEASIASPSVSARDRQDAQADIETVRAQLKKEKPNRAIMSAAVETLRDITGLAEIGEKLAHLIH